jgi:3-oxoacyl-[acyl-carrier protein] reductase
MVGALSGRAVIVTGGGRGIGKAASVLFAREGASVLVATRTPGPGEQVVDAIRAGGGKADLLAIDISTRQSVRHVVAKALESFGRIDIVLHNAAAMTPSNIVSLSDDTLDRILDVNLKAAFWFGAEALPHLSKSDAGRLLFTSSITGSQHSHPGYAAYGASKAGLNGFIRQAAYEFSAHGITVNGVAPGIVFTEAALAALSPSKQDAISARIPRGRAGAPEEIAHVLLMLAHPAASHVTGQIIVVDGGQSLGMAQRE